jgi:hypothetical protein
MCMCVHVRGQSKLSLQLPETPTLALLACLPADPSSPQPARYMLCSWPCVHAAGGQGDGGRKARQYIEDEATGEFYKLHSKRRRLFNLLKRKEATEMVWPGCWENWGGLRVCAQ